MSSPHWCISTYLGKNQTRIRREGFSTRKQCFKQIEQYWPNLNNFAPGYKLEEDPTTTIVVMSKSPSGIRTVHLLITSNHNLMSDPLSGPFPMLLVPSTPLIMVGPSPDLYTITLCNPTKFWVPFSRVHIDCTRIHELFHDIIVSEELRFKELQSNKTLAYAVMKGRNVFYEDWDKTIYRIDAPGSQKPV